MIKFVKEQNNTATIKTDIPFIEKTVSIKDEEGNAKYTFGTDEVAAFGMDYALADVNIDGKAAFCVPCMSTDVDNRKVYGKLLAQLAKYEADIVAVINAENAKAAEEAAAIEAIFA